MLSPEFWQNAWQQERRDRRDNAKAQIPGQRLPALRRHIHQLFNIAKHQSCLRCDVLAGGGDRDLPVRPVDQLRVEYSLEFLDGIAR